MEGIKTISIEDENYPHLLKKIPNPPKIIYYKGIIKKEEPCFAVVGTRKFSLYGRQASFDITSKLAEAGIVIVSGLAPGIDTFAHLATTKINKRTIAVLGTGLDEKSIYPKENIGLAHKIVEIGGCLISEYPPGTKGSRFSFPARNRIIAGLSYGILVVESNETGGSMITAGYGITYKRKLFALPGNIYSLNSLGAHKLIKYGAKLAGSANDIIKELSQIPGLFPKSQENLPISDFSATKEGLDLTDKEKLIIDILKEPLHIDKIIEIAKISPSEAASALTVLEIKNKIKNIGSGVYASLI